MTISYENHHRAGEQLCRDIGLPFDTDRDKLAMLLRAERRLLSDRDTTPELDEHWLRMIEDIFEESING